MDSSSLYQVFSSAEGSTLYPHRRAFNPQFHEEAPGNACTRSQQSTHSPDTRLPLAGGIPHQGPRVKSMSRTEPTQMKGSALAEVTGSQVGEGARDTKLVSDGAVRVSEVLPAGQRSQLRFPSTATHWLWDWNGSHLPALHLFIWKMTVIPGLTSSNCWEM